MMVDRRRTFVLSVVLLMAASSAWPACMNKFFRRSEGPRQIITLLTGKLTFEEAEKLAAAIAAGEAPPLEWVDEKGKRIARQHGDLKVVRPMPVGCDGKTSGVILVVTFMSFNRPSERMLIKLGDAPPVEFEEQT